MKQYDNQLHIKPTFLYAMTLTDKETGATLVISQMLSENHNMKTMIKWLQTYQNEAKIKPEEATTDFSRPLMQAVCQVFNKKTVNQYLVLIYEIMSGSQKSIPKKMCFLRLDKSHVCAMFARWKVIII